MVGIEIDRGLIVTALVGAGYLVYAVNPMASSRYRDRHATSGAKSDPGDAKVLADLVRTDRHNHREVAGDSELVEGIKILARAHQNAIWGRQRQINALRSSLREYYPGALAAFGTDLSNTDAVSVLSDRADSGDWTPALEVQDRFGSPPWRTAAAISRRRPKRSRPPCGPTISKLLGALPRRTGRWLDRPWPSSRHIRLRSPASRSRWPNILSSTRTPRSSSPCQDWGRSSALGCWASSVMTELAIANAKSRKTTPARRRSPRPRDRAMSCWPASPETGAWPMRSTNGPSAR